MHVNGSLPRRIHLLPPALINRIAAGEVVERPASVVKELVENALDAGATRIDIQAGNGGRTLRVADNGCGLAAEDLALAFTNHATSKLLTEADLENGIATLGFRGEALASIAAISRLICTSRTSDAPNGSQVTLEGGVMGPVLPTGCAVGTSMGVEDLFFNTPARLKFLKRPQTELAAVEETVQLLALSRPDVRFTLTLNGRGVLTTPGDGDFARTAQAVWGVDVSRLAATDFLLTQFEDETLPARVEAYFATPAALAFHQKSKKAWWQLLNGRGIRCGVLSRAIESAFVSLVPEKAYPLCAVHLRLPPDQVDVNVHPTKKEVRYLQPNAVYALARHTIRQALMEQFQPVYALNGATDRFTVASAPPTDETAACGSDPLSTVGTENLKAVPSATTNATPPRHPVVPAPPRSPESVQASLMLFAPASLAPETPAWTMALPEAVPSPRPWRVIGQLMKTYVLLESQRGLLVVDQHIASERALYERLMRNAQLDSPASQILLTPLTLHVSVQEVALLHQHTAQLEALGYAWTLQESEWQVTAVPLLYPGRKQLSVPDQLRHLLRQLEDTGEATPDLEYLVSTLACHQAVRAGDVLTLGQMDTLIEDWLACSLPWSCPHGRPISHTIAADELNAFFDRPSLPAGV